MKISNETKVGSITAIAIVLLIIGYNFLKGNNLLAAGGQKIFATFDSVGSLEVSNPVYVKGYQVGTVSDIKASDIDISKIFVTIKFTKEVRIPDNSIAMIVGNPLGNSSIALYLGDSKDYAKAGDTLNTKSTESLLTMLKGTLDPTLTRLNRSLESIDTAVKRIGKLFDDQAQKDLHVLISNLKLTSDELVTVSRSVKIMTDPQNGALSRSLTHVEKLTDSISSRSGSIAKSMDNLEKVTNGLAQADIGATVSKLKSATEKLSGILEKIDKGQGSLGSLINDKTLYNELNSAVYNYKLLAQDLRVHPKRYISLSVFGKKDKSGPITSALPDSMPNQQNK